MPVVRSERNNEASRAFAREHMDKGVGTIYKPPSGLLETKPSEQQDQSAEAGCPEESRQEDRR